MAKSQELKPRSFRVDDETANKFKEITDKIGGNQQETLAKLIEAYEFQTGKAILTEKKPEIDQFEKYVTAISRMFMGSLEDNQNITNTVRTEFEALLQSKDTTIQDLQSQLKVANQLKEDAVSRAKHYTDENTQLNEQIRNLKSKYESKIEDLMSMLSDKDSLNKALTDSCNELKLNMDKMKSSIEDISALQSERNGLLEKQKELSMKVTELEKQLEHERTEHDALIFKVREENANSTEYLKEQLQIVQEKALLDLERKHHETLVQLEVEKQAEINKYQQRYLELLEQRS